MARTRHGKIFSLPPHLCEEVNLRLQGGKELRGIVRWLNGHEEVRTMLAEKFDGQPVSIQNLSDWKKHGHREWQVRCESLEDARAMKEQAAELKEATGGALADQIAEVLMARLMRAFRNWDGNLQSRSGQELVMLRSLCREAGEMRRGSHSAARLQMEREHLELEQRKHEEFMKAEFDKWLETPEAKNRALTIEEKRQRSVDVMRQIFGVQPLAKVESGGKDNGNIKSIPGGLSEAPGIEPPPDENSDENGVHGRYDKGTSTPPTNE